MCGPKEVEWPISRKHSRSGIPIRDGHCLRRYVECTACISILHNLEEVTGTSKFGWHLLEKELAIRNRIPLFLELSSIIESNGGSHRFEGKHMGTTC